MTTRTRKISAVELARARHGHNGAGNGEEQPARVELTFRNIRPFDELTLYVKSRVGLLTPSMIQRCDVVVDCVSAGRGEGDAYSVQVRAINRCACIQVRACGTDLFNVVDDAFDGVRHDLASSGPIKAMRQAAAAEEPADLPVLQSA